MKDSEIIVDNFAGDRPCVVRKEQYGYAKKKCVKSYAGAPKVCKNEGKINLREGK
ncbi:hypothetical protein [Klebsiella quasipneumoniae]|uniref:hypothetical protein n=1 Tax=Klebsiella quasipneumoniae TaxID=1463165 RepID=UPI003D6DA425